VEFGEEEVVVREGRHNLGIICQMSNDGKRGGREKKEGEE